MDYFIYFVALLLLLAVALFIKVAIFNRRPQKSGLIFILLSVPLFLIYYQDVWPERWGRLTIRDWALTPLANRSGLDPNFESMVLPAAIVAAILLVHLTVFQRVAVRERLQRVANPIANFFAGSVMATLVDATLVSTFHLGWVGAVVIGVVFTLVYLGVIALLAALLEVIVEIAKYFMVWIKRKVFALATMLTRASSWLSSLSGRLGLQSFADRIRQDTMEQEARFHDEQEAQDRALYEAYLRDRARRRRLIQGGHLPPEPDEPRPAAAPAQAATEATPVDPMTPGVAAGA